ncbi:fumarylacetoacetate hydrolase family protein [Microlunatus panaciterrae]|uniref:2-dehydro-3-deoxy-D-arabinonate dehydratase n=1 Tax=Microlunatus panaciterrae TaxID=400768 RepID=A0ABS2RM12_9ACTN|nr:fumarylacetoacetate hydrolase family protein [Microlunatus panaciterrae]MBM7800053.1 2-dehydro-3-deoxy-D-arabinonate dehydratase [Microlunatus panaciterrae]
MALVRFSHNGVPTLGVDTDDGIRPLELTLAELLALPLDQAQTLVQTVQADPVDASWLLPPVDVQEVWAAGVTYRRSRDGRIEESGNETLYDHVYASARPEIFFKSTAGRVVTDQQPVGIRADSGWDVPEAEIGLVINSAGEIFGFLVGNDMSSRSIEGENALYLPQAKVYEASCALGHRIVGVWEAPELPLAVSVSITRDGEQVYSAHTDSSAMKRGFEELVDWLTLAMPFPDGVVLLTGTGLVPDSSFTVRAGDLITVQIDGVDSLTNPVITVGGSAPDPVRTDGDRSSSLAR